MSKFREQVQLEKEVNKAPSKTMGPAKVDVPSPQKYLLKHSKQPKLPESTCPALFETIWSLIYNIKYRSMFFIAIIHANIICRGVETTEAVYCTYPNFAWIFSFSEKPFKYEDDELHSKPPIPARTDKPLMGLHSNKDFIKTNAVENIMTVPKKPQPVYAYTKKGDKQLLENSGLVPKYIKKKVRGEMGRWASCFRCSCILVTVHTE